ncbi:uncharacterized protein LOC124419931 isoform X1 [Lucilia cuprina]|uniref:uncharacterized protein LOC124419931 isoform X1 n=2 Tax=Lucilia cuprina TaxID=7375 RepID=UPI001F0669F4|nr:uncharacterized protein LOC124419931 isoform X1 [Lucilia cuprina]
MMFKYILLCSFLVHIIRAKPVHQHHGELAPHVLIVTPQAQLRLESLVPGTPIIQHLSPFTRFVAPHEETIVYVPASAAAAIQNAEIVSRSLEGNKGKQINPQDFTNALTTIASNSAQSLQNAAESAATAANSYITSSSTYVPNLGNPASGFQTAAEALYQGAQSTINSYVQSQQQSQQPQAQAQTTQLLSAETPLAAAEISLPPIIAEQKLPIISTAVSLPPLISTEQKLPLISIGSKIPSLSSLLSPALPSISIYTNEPRHHYFVAPAAPHVVDYVPSSIVLSPATATTIKARRSVIADDKEANKPILPLILPEPTNKPLALPLNNELEKEELLLKEKKEEFKRFLEANALKEESKEQQLELKPNEDIKLAENEKIQKLNLENNPLELKLSPLAPAEKEDDTPQTKEA